MTKALVHTSLLLLDVFLLPRAARAQSQVAGNLAVAAPYGIPPDLFNASISHTVKQSSVYVPGYNLSAPEGSGPSGNGSAVNGWQLGVAVSKNVPLKHAADDVDKKGVIDATTLWLQAPEGVGRLNTTAWKLCATVFPFVNMSMVDAVRTTTVPRNKNDGNCGPWVTDQCAAALTKVGVAFGVTENGDCYNVNVPPACLPYFESGKGNGTTIPLDENTLDDGRFFAWGSVPTARDDTSTLTEALNHVWPVLLTWVQFGPSGKIFSANTHISCVIADVDGTGSSMERHTSFGTRSTSNAADWLAAHAAWTLTVVAVSTACICLF